MEFIFILIALAAILFVGSILGFVANAKVGRLEVEVERLRARVEGGITAKSAQILSDRKPSPSDIEIKSPVKPKTPDPTPQTPVKAAALQSSEPVIRQMSDTNKPKFTPPKRKPTPAKPKRSFEQEIGARWAVWVGGLTLALGAVFLLRFAVEAGIFSPAMRVGMAIVLGIVALGAGEFLRRKDAAFFAKTLKLNDIQKTAYIPGILTGVGIFALYGAVYAAYALYGLILPFTTFAGMAVVSFIALGLSLIQGPKIAALGLIGSLVTPMLVSANPPNFMMLFSYLTVVTAASVFLSRVKTWGWLTSAALFGALFWMWKTVPAATLGVAFWPWILFAGGLFAASVWLGTKGRRAPLFVVDFNVERFAGGTARMWFAIWAVIVFLFDLNFGFTWLQHSAALMAAGALMVAGFVRPRVPQLIVLGGALAFALTAEFTSVNHVKSMADIKGWLITAGPLTALFTAFTFIRMRGESDPISLRVWAALGAFLPIGIALTSPMMPGFTVNHVAGLMLVLLAANASQAAFAPRSSNESVFAYFGAAAFYCTGAAIAYTLAAIFSLTGWHISLTMMLGIVLTVGAHRFLPESILKVTACGFAALTAAHVLFWQIPDASTVGPRFIFNSLWFYFVLPAAICAAAAWAMQKDKDDIWPEILKAAALSFAALFAVLQVRHLMNDGALLSGTFGFDEMAMQVAVGLCFTVGGLRLGKTNTDKNRPSLLSVLAMGISGLTLALFVLGVCLGFNPLLNASTVVNGNLVFNSLALAYLLPAIALAAIAVAGRDTRSKIYIRICGGISLLSFMLYITAQIRFSFSGRAISIFDNWPGDLELYAISAAWLLLGIALLALGIKMKRQDIRLASALVIILTVLKAFLIDMASLEGALRALSFVVLGIVLIVIGRVYQRLLFKEISAED